MNKTRKSLFYVAGYLLGGGSGLLFFPRLTLKLFLAKSTSDDIFIRMLGIMLLALGMIVVQIIRHRVEVLYPTTIFVRVGILTGMVVLYAVYRDPLMIVLATIVGIGLAMTTMSYCRDKKG